MSRRAFAVIIVLAIIVIVASVRRQRNLGSTFCHDRFETLKEQAASFGIAKSDPRLDFRPVPELVCGLEPVPEYAVDVTGRGAEGTVVWEPFEARSEHNEVRSKGFESRSRRVSSQRNDILDDVFGRPSSSVLAGTVGRSPTNIKSRNSSCPGALSHLDSDVNSELVTAQQVLCDNDEVRFGPKHVGKDLPDSRASRALLLGDKLAAEWNDTQRDVISLKYYNKNIIRDPAILRMGLGSTYRDPLFQPGPQKRIPTAGAYAGNGYGPAQGTHAGGNTLGALVPATFLPSAQWDTEYVKGFGGEWGPDYSLRSPPVEVLVTASQ